MKKIQFPTAKSRRFFLISVKMDPECEVMGFQFEPEKSISSPEGNTTERDTFVRKDCNPSESVEIAPH